jgi:pyruvate/2-oxoglutarate/acetoin dehydrogenase E1 component
LRRAGSDLAIVSYGAYVHLALRVAETLARDGVEASVLDLRSLQPLDRDALLTVARHCGKVLIAHEDSRTGGIGESLAAIIQEQCFEDLDAPCASSVRSTRPSPTRPARGRVLRRRGPRAPPPAAASRPGISQTRTRHPFPSQKKGRPEGAPYVVSRGSL